MAKLVDKTYGQALFDLAAEENRVDNFAAEADAIKTVFTQNPDLLVLLDHPQITKEQKLEVINNSFKGRISDELMGFLTIILKAGRQKFMPEIFDYFLNAVKAYRRIGVVYIASAAVLSEGQQADVKKRLLEITDFVDYEMHFKVDAGLLGGMVIRIGDKVVDTSIRTRLLTMSRELAKLQISEQ